MYEECYDLNEEERQEVARFLAAWERNGRRHFDAANNPAEYLITSTHGFLVGDDGCVYRMVEPGTPKMYDESGHPQGSPHRCRCIEMWNGHWRKVLDPATGKPAYAKCIIWVPMESHVNKYVGLSHIAWYRGRKQYRHPHEEPHRPTKREVDAMEGQLAERHTMILARMEQEGLDTKGSEEPPSPAVSDAPLPKPPKRRSNKRKKPVGVGDGA